MPFTTFHASSVQRENVAEVLHDYLLLDRVRIWRHLLVTRFGLLALGTFLVGRLIPGLSAFGRWIPMVMFLAPPVLAVIVELWVSLRLSGGVDQRQAEHTCTVVMESELDEVVL